jgi:hypothetical protein
VFKPRRNSAVSPGTMVVRYNQGDRDLGCRCRKDGPRPTPRRYSKASISTATRSTTQTMCPSCASATHQESNQRHGRPRDERLPPNQPRALQAVVSFRRNTNTKAKSTRRSYSFAISSTLFTARNCGCYSRACNRNWFFGTHRWMSFNSGHTCNQEAVPQAGGSLVLKETRNKSP